MDCRLGHKYQRSVCDICVMYLHRGSLLGVVTRPNQPGQDHRVVSHWRPNDVLKTIVLTSQYADEVEKAPMEVVGRRGSW